MRPIPPETEVRRPKTGRPCAWLVDAARAERPRLVRSIAEREREMTWARSLPRGERRTLAIERIDGDRQTAKAELAAVDRLLAEGVPATWDALAHDVAASIAAARSRRSA